jgi:3-hydroxyisobutyrate dehydrogenase
MTLRVAVVGTGRMGSAMVGRVAAGGFPVVVHNRSRGKAEAVAARHGCEVADTARDAVAGADVVLVSLPDDAAARGVRRRRRTWRTQAAHCWTHRSPAA